MTLSDIQLPSNRKFGLFFALIFLAIGGYAIWTESETFGFLFVAIGIGFLLFAFLKPDALLPLNKLWMQFGLLLGLIIQPIVLGVIFFGLFTPVALLMKISGRDELRLRLMERASYWRVKEVDVADPPTFKNQF
ncbi:MAG: hypothetical protein HOI70_00660 [Opitutae bacterium]|mgnify:CR=1 FL=1|jgi:hypothetical protein|nr:hypothetical protein [Opitutae bacterium]